MKILFFILPGFFCLSVSAQFGVGVQYDNTFGRFGGSEFTQISQGTSYTDMAVQQDNKPVCAGTYSNGTNFQPAVVRYKVNGERDSSFGVNGFAVSFLQNADIFLTAMFLQTDGKIVVSGYTTTTTVSSTDFLLARYTSDGHPDSSFGTNGFAIKDVSPFVDWLEDAAPQEDGKIVASGYTFNGEQYVFAAVRYNTNGTADSTFDGDGVALVDAGGYNSYSLALAVQPNGKLLLAGYSKDINDRSGFTVARLKTDGTPDSSFGTNGIVYPVSPGLNDRLEDIIVLPDGKIIAAGEIVINTGSQSDFTLVKMDSTGMPDTDFGTGGISQVNLWNSLSLAKKIALQPDLKIIVTGSINFPNGEIVIVRFNADGTLDTNFDNDGFIGNAGSDPDNAFQANAVVLSGFRIYIAGTGIPTSAPEPQFGIISALLNVGSPVSLRLLEFAASGSNMGITLHWQTIAERNTQSFVIEKSTDGSHFSELGKITASGLSSGSSYNFFDASLSSATIFYRLKMVKADGTYQYSNIIKITGKDMVVDLSVYPNPAKDVLTVTVSGVKGMASIKVAGVNGNIIQQVRKSFTGRNVFSINIAPLPAGNYYLLLATDTGLQHQKFIKQ